MGKWEMVRLGDVCEVLDSMRVPVTASNRKAGIYPYYGANGIQDYVDEYIFDDELVLLAEDGGNFGSKTRPIAYRVSGKCWVNNHAHVLKPKDMLNIDYLCYSIMFYDVAKIISGTTRAKLNQSAMRKMTIPLPPLKIQQNIAATLDTAAALLKLRQQQLAELEALIQSVFYQMFGDPVRNEKGWELHPIGGTTKSIIAGWSVNGEVRTKKHDEIAVLKVSAVTQGVFRPDEYKVISKEQMIKKYVFPEKGDLIFSRANTREMVGATAIVDRDYPDLLLPDKLWKILFLDFVNVYFMKYILSTPAIRSEFSNQSTGTSGSMYNVSMEKFKNIKIPLPPLSLQTQFAAIVQKIDQQKALVQQSIDETQTLFDSLMSQYFD